jgi:O-antigen ligase
MMAGTIAARLDKTADGLHLLMLFVLPWIGVGTVKSLLGADTGAGFQPAYLLLAAAIGARGLAALTGARRLAPRLVSHRDQSLVWGCGLVLLAVLLSAYGVAFHRSLLATPGQAWWRFAKQMLQLLVMLAFLLETAKWTRTPERWRASAHWLAAGLLLQAVYGVWQAFAFYHPHELFRAVDALATSNPAILSGSAELFVGERMSGLPRVRGTAAEPLYLGSFLLLVLPLIWSELRGWPRRISSTVAILLLLATWSRGALAGLGVFLLVVAILGRRAGWLAPLSRRQIVLGSIIVGAVVVVVVAWAGPRVLLLPLERLLQIRSGGDWSNLTRWFSMQAAWRGFALSPWFGIGWGQFGFHFPVLVDPLGLQSQFTWPVVNNLALLMLCETGLVGSLVVGAWLVRGARSVLRATTAAGAAAAPHVVRRIVMLAAGTAGGIAQLLTFSQYNLPHIWVGWGLLAAALLAAPPASCDGGGCGGADRSPRAGSRGEGETGGGV